MRAFALLLSTVATVLATTGTPIQTYYQGPQMKFSWDSGKKAIKAEISNVYQNSEFKIIWNSFKNLKYTGGRDDEAQFDTSPANGNNAGVTDKFNGTNNVDPEYGSGDGTTVTQTSVEGSAPFRTVATYTFFRKPRYPDATHRNLTCGRPLEFSWKGRESSGSQEYNGTFWIEMNKDCTDLTNYQTVKPSNAPPDASYFQPKNSSTGFSCSMDGYTKMVLEITELSIIVISMYKEIWAAILPNNLSKAIKYAYAGLTGVSGWIGYGISALYYLAEDQGFGDTLCEISGYGAVVVEALYKMIDFGDTSTVTV